MVAVPFDTLRFAEKLEAGGFTPQQARAAAEAFADAIGESVVTRDYLDLRLSEMKHDLTQRLGAKLAASVAIVGALLKLH